MNIEGEERFGLNIVRRALEEPIRQIANNAGYEGSVVVEHVKNGSGAYGFNAETEKYGDLVEAGVMDPTKVVRFALQNAASVASLLLTTEAVIAEKPKKKDPPMMPGGGGMGGDGRHGRYVLMPSGGDREKIPVHPANECLCVWRWERRRLKYSGSPNP